jgi:hypothetical protein
LKPATLAQIKKEIKLRSPEDIEQLCLRLARFKKENKELLTYLLFEADDEQGYVTHIKESIDEEFDSITNTNFYYLKKSVRKILRNVKKYVRYSSNKETEVAIVLHFCERLISFKPSIARNITLHNIYDRQMQLIDKKIDGLHEDLQLDYRQDIEALDEE